MKNKPTVELVKINKEEGLVFVSVNVEGEKKTVKCIMHENGEVDYEELNGECFFGDSVGFDEVMDFVNFNEEISKAFPVN
ncbi:MAG: hypothetical protein EBW87_04180 [Burkholderiaceae bacterium]|jgi:hypothetical protein|nr:hypothetical protein [Burkholderiaceae bacterium]